MTLEKAFGIVLVESRKKANLSQEALAHECGLDRTYISLLERGRRQPTLKTLFLISSALQLTPSDVISQVESILFDRPS